jgi:16S rRNA G1207 methylase RsmC
MPPRRRRVAVIGCHDGGLAIALAQANPHDVIAGFDANAVAIAAARRAAARHGVSDRVTFEAAAPGRLLGAGYDLVVMLDFPPRGR